MLGPVHAASAFGVACCAIDSAFASFMRERPDALFIGNDPFFTSRVVQLALLAGGLMNYGTSLTDAYRQLGVYAGRILKGAQPEDLPVVQSSKLELVINASTAWMLGLTVPQTLLVAAER